MNILIPRLSFYTIPQPYGVTFERGIHSADLIINLILETKQHGLDWYF